MNNPIPLIKALAKPDQAMVTEAVNDWLDDHPEATTTVQDGAITKAKLNTALQNSIDAIPAVDATLATSGAAADAKKTGDEISGLKSALNDTETQLYAIREPKANICYFTEFSSYKYAGGVYTSWVDKTKLKIWGTATSWVRFNLLNGNTELVAGAPSYSDKNLSAGTYTLKASDTLLVFHGANWDGRKRWNNGESITINSDELVWMSTTANNQAFGTTDEPSYFSIEIYEGAGPIVPTAVDLHARSAIGATGFNNRLTHDDFDYDRPYNIFNGTTWTANKKVNYLDGSLDDETGRYATDYIEIDPANGYLCLNIYVVLYYEGSGLVSGGNRVWVHTNWAFYDANKQYINTADQQNNSSKAIPANAKYVRLTADSEAILPYVVLFYGEYNTQQWVRYTEYRKNITEKSVYAATGMENLRMVMFGDSITQGVATTDEYFSYVEYAADYLRGMLINCGLGGSRMSQGSPDGIGLASFASLCENIVSDDAGAWDALEAYAAENHTEWLGQIAALKAVDWNAVQAIGLLYGANDWHNNVSVGTEYNEDPTNYDGACAYGLKLLLTKYPHLQVIIFTPFYRTAENTDSDAANTAGVNMDAYGASLMNVQKIFHCPVVDSGNGLGLNKYTYTSYTSESDGTHPRKLLGLQRIGRFVAESIKRFIQPY